MLILGLQAGTAHAYIAPERVMPTLMFWDTLQAQVGDRPMFYRAGEQIRQAEQVPEVEQIPNDPFTQPDSPFDAFPEQQQPIEPEPVEEEFDPSQYIEPEPEEPLEEEPVEEQPQEKATKASASTFSVVVKLVNRLKYLVAAILLAGLAFVYFFKKKKAPASASPEMAQAAAAGMEGEQPIPAPENTQQTEGQQSDRLKKALEAMGDAGKAYPHQPTDSGEDDSVSFSAPEPPKQE